MYNRIIGESTEALRARIYRNMQTSAECWQRELNDNIQRLDKAGQLLDAAFNAICGGTLNCDTDGSELFEHIEAAQRSIKALQMKEQLRLKDWTNGRNVAKYTEQELQATLDAENEAEI